MTARRGTARRVQGAVVPAGNIADGEDDPSDRNDEDVEKTLSLDLSTCPRVILDVSFLVTGMQVRIAGVDESHVAMLAEAPGQLPPIVVHAATMTVVDGAHRVHAARARGESCIEAILVDVNATDAFVLAVGLNTRHGLPLSRADRRIAVTRILQCHPDWSDRRIATVAGVSPKTVGAVRQRSNEALCQPVSRVGSDGRVRRLDVAAARRHASELFQKQPDVTLRQAAKAAGISLSTAHDVRRRLEQEPPTAPTPDGAVNCDDRDGSLPQGHRPRPPQSDPGASGAAPSVSTHRTSAPPAPEADRSDERAQAGTATCHGVAHDRSSTPDVGRTLENLSGDPSVRGSETGRHLLRLLWMNAQGMIGSERLARSVPPHRRRTVARLARQCAENWMRLASEIDQVETTPRH